MDWYSASMYGRKALPNAIRKSKDRVYVKWKY